jgi:2-C-methyl-D-erythritol 2,4-cyclodiphosphate synthase
MNDLRIGHGYDVHAFQAGDHIVLGGVTIPHHQAFKAHSDGDVLLHAVCDALLGALALGDIGQHFPDTDARYKGIDSRQLLSQVVALIRQHGYSVSNLDTTIIAQAPKMAAHTLTMRQNIAADLGVDVSRVNVKATTTEHLGFAGREEGIAVHAVVLLQSGKAE